MAAASRYCTNNAIAQRFTNAGCRVPLDIIELIVEQLSSIGSVWALQQCSLVCKDFAAICQRHIFTNIVLSNFRGGFEGTHRTFPALASFKKALDNKPYLEGYVRVLDYSHNLDGHSHWPPVFRRLRHVRSLHIRLLTKGDLSWCSSTITPSFKSSFRRFIQSNQIARLDLFSIHDLPSHIFALLPCLEDLEMVDITLDNDPPFVQTNPPKLHSLCVDAGAQQPVDIFMKAQHRIVDLRALKHLDIRLGCTTPMIECLIQQSAVLESVKFDGTLPFLDMDYTLTRYRYLPDKSLQSLRSIDLTTELSNIEHDPYLNLTSELEKLTGRNALEDLTFFIMVPMRSTCNTEISRWSELDRVLSQPAAFPHLRHVQVIVDVTWFQQYERNKEMEVRLVTICEQAFPWLKVNEEVKFELSLDISQLDSKEICHMTF